MSSFSSRLLRWWVRLYTSGLSADEQGDRRDEIESNHFEHTNYDSAEKRVGPSWQVVGRMLRGLPADLMWRLSRPGVERQAMRGGVSVAGRGGVAIALVAYRSYIVVAAALVAVALTIAAIVGVTLVDGGGGPDAVNRIAFQSFRSGSWNIYTMRPDGTEEMRLTGGASTDMFPALSPDGSEIVFGYSLSGRRDLYVMAADGTEVRQLTDTPDTHELDPAWSPDGRRIAYTAPEGEGTRSRRIYVMDADGSNKTRLTGNEDGEEFPRWSPDGRRVTFSAALDDGDWDIYVIGIDGTGQVRLTDTPGLDVAPDWSPDGDRIAFMSKRDGDLEIYVMNPDGSGQTRVTDRPELSQLSGISWSPDGSLIAFVSTRDGNSEIYAIDVETGKETRITNDPVADVWPSWR